MNFCVKLLFLIVCAKKTLMKNKHNNSKQYIKLGLGSVRVGSVLGLTQTWNEGFGLAILKPETKP